MSDVVEIKNDAFGAVGDAAEGVAANVSAAGRATASAAGEAMDAARPIATGAAGAARDAGAAVVGTSAAVASAARPAAAAAVAGAGAAAGAVSEHGRAIAGDVANLAAQSGGQVYTWVSGRMGDVNWGQIDSAYTQSREMTAEALAAMAGLGKQCVDLIKVDIFRDMYQVLSLCIANLASAALSKAKAVWGTISGLVALDFSAVISSIPRSTWYTFLIIIGILVLLTVVFAFCKAKRMNTDAIREGHEAQTWKEKTEANPKSIKLIRWTLWASVSLYLPLSRTAFQVVKCDGEIKASFQDLGLQCDGPALGIALIVIALITIGLPLYTGWLIQRNKPVGSPEDSSKRYNEDGDLVEYTDEMYMRDVLESNDQRYCPYQFLYKGYERRWAWYKVFVMVIKFVLVLPIIFISSILVRNILTLLVLVVFAGASAFTSPFIDPMADVMDLTGRASTALSVGLGIISLQDVAPSSATAVGLIINILQAVNFAIMGLAWAMGNKKVQTKIKNLRGQFYMHDLVRDAEAPFWKIMPYYNVYRECKRRLWHAFWNSLLLNQFDEGVCKRMIELQDAVSKFGAHRVREHFEGLRDPNVARWRLWVQQHLEGVDAFFDGVPRDGNNDSKTFFGKMYCVPYPFICVFVADDSDDVAFVTSDTFLDFAQKNARPEIMAKRELRQKLRALDGQSVYFHHVQMESHSVEDGTETYTDNEGRQQTRAVRSTVQVEMHYNNGHFGVAANTSKPFAAGFKTSISYSDGRGTAIAPRTGRQVTVTGSTSISGAQFGLTDQMVMTPKLGELLDNPSNSPKWQARLPAIRQEAQQYRDTLMQERLEKERTLNSGFWHFVYDNMDLTLDMLRGYLEHSETNPKMKSLLTEHRAGIEFLYKRVAFVKTHPATMFWYTVWSDVWESNKDMTKLAGLDEHFDPMKGSSIVYSPMNREQLDAWFASHGDGVAALRTPKKLVSDRFVSMLYKIADKYQQLAAEKGMGTDRRSADFALTPELWAGEDKSL